MNSTERLSQLIYDSQFERDGKAPWYDACAEYLMEHGVTVPPCKIGDKIYAICYGIDDNEEASAVSELTVTEVGQRYLFFSAWATPGDDLGFSESIGEIGKTLFFTKEEAEHAIERRR